MKHVFLLIAFLIAPSFLFAENIEVKRERIFTGTGLFGYMNGGAELFLEYGVKKLTTRDLVYLGEEYALDIYEMPTPEDAYGIYSVHTFKCLEADRGDGLNCLSTYQLQSVIGNCYVSLVFTSGTEKARENADQVMEQYISGLNKSKVQFPEQIAVSQPYSGVLKFLRGAISLSGAQFSLATQLKDIPFTGVWLFPSENPDEKYALILLNTKEDYAAATERFEKADILKKGENWLYVRSRDGEQEKEDHGPFGF